MMAQMGESAGQKLGKIADQWFINSVSFEESQTMYKEWSEKGDYDELHKNPDEYGALSVLKRTMEKFFKDPENTLILDLGAGTGMSGQTLYNCGFRKLHALEPCKGFADIAETKGVFSKFLMETIGFDKPISAASDSYDGIIAVGSFVPGHIPCNALHEIVRVIKPGGYFINLMREEYLWTIDEYKDRLEPLMQQLEKEGKWKMLVRETYYYHFLNNPGKLFVFQVC